MKMYFEGITRNTEDPRVIAELKKAGYKELHEVIEHTDEVLVHENPTLAEINAKKLTKAEEKAATKAVKDGG